MHVHLLADKEIVLKAINFAPKDVDMKTGVVTGYFASFGEIDRDNDMIMMGAFAESILERGPNATGEIKHLLHHRSTMPLGEIRVLKEDQEGLYFETKFTVGVDYVNDTLLQYQNKVYNNHSIGFRYEEMEYIEDDPMRGSYWQVNKVKLIEGSTVTWGANPNTPFEGFKSMSGAAIVANFKDIADQISNIRSFLREGITDETAKQAEQDLMKMQADLAHKLSALPEYLNTKKFKQETPFDVMAEINKH